MKTLYFRTPPDVAKLLVKVVVLLEPSSDSWHNFQAETLWAENLKDNLCRIRNVPFVAYDLSNEDVVTVESEDGRLTMTGVVARGGHSTYRIIPNARIDYRGPAFQECWGRLKALGCSYESYEDRVFAVDVPPAANIHIVYRQLEEGEKNGVWDFEEGHCGHMVPE